MMVAMRRSGAELGIYPSTGEDVLKKSIWDRFVDDLTHDPVVTCSRTPVSDAIGVRLAKPLTHPSRFHIYARPMGEMTFVSGEVALTEDNIETLHWETNVGMTPTEDVADSVQEVLDRLVVGVSVMDTLASVAVSWGIILAMAGDSVILAYFKGEIIGQIAVGASGGGIELAPGYLDSPDRSDAAEEAWRWFYAPIRQILDSKII